MADNTTLNSGSGGDTIRDVAKAGGVKTPVCVIDAGGSGAEALISQAATTFLPVRLTDGTNFYDATGGGGGGNVTVTNFPATQAVSAASLPLPAGAATETTLAALSAKLAAGSPIGNVGLVPVTSGGLSVGRVVSANTTNATSVKAGPGQLYGYFAFNTNATDWRYLKLYDKAAAPTVGTDTPLLVIGIPPGGGANVSFPNGVQFASGVALGIVTGIADADATAPAANEVVVNVTYK